MKVWVVTALSTSADCCGTYDNTVVDSVHVTEESARIRETELDDSFKWEYGDVTEMEITE